MINKWEFEGTVVHLYNCTGRDDYSVTLKGVDPSGHTVEMACLVGRAVLDRLGLVGKYSRMRLEGHFETYTTIKRSGEEKKKLLKICDRVVAIDNTKKPWYVGQLDDFAQGHGYSGNYLRAQGEIF